jgi:hypothetical protein
MKYLSHIKICYKEIRKSHLFLYFYSEIHVFAPQNYGAMQTLPRKIPDPFFFAPQNHRDFVLCPAKLWSNADFAPRNRADIVSGANKYPQT